MKVIIHDKCTWEPDYIRYDLLKDYPDFQYLFVETGQLLNINNYRNFEKGKEEIIFVFNTLKVKFDEIEPIVKYTKPVIIIQCSDEFGDDPRWTGLAEHTKLFLKQYNHSKEKEDKILQIPLGYMTNMLFKKDSLQITELNPIKERFLTWSFCGSLKQDREEMLTIFKKWLPTHSNPTNVYPHDMFTIYQNSIFVPNGRGTINLDCFRLYETILAGAIPVVVGSEEELKRTFFYNGDKPLFVYAQTWEEAVKTCTLLLKSPKFLQKLQDELVAWWKRQILEIRRRVSLVL